MHVYILHLRCENAILAILRMDLPITATISGKWLNILTFHDDNKCITANGQMMINDDANKIYHVTIIHLRTNFFSSAGSFLI